MKIEIKNVEDQKTMNTMNTIKSVIKMAAGIGNGAMFGGLVPILVGGSMVPIKICACISAYILGEILTEKTDAYIDDNFKIEKHTEDEEG